MTESLPECLPCYSVKVKTPDGTMFVHISEHNDLPVLIQINIGKAGTNLAAWADSTARLVTDLLPLLSIHKVIEKLSNITSSGVQWDGTRNCYSGPEGLVIALLKYRAIKFAERRPRARPGRASFDPR